MKARFAFVPFVNDPNYFRLELDGMTVCILTPTDILEMVQRNPDTSQLAKVRLAVEGIYLDSRSERAENRGI